MGQSRTLNGLGVDIQEVIVAELVGESSDALPSEVRRLMVEDRGGVAEYGEVVLVRQSSTSPVVPG